MNLPLDISRIMDNADELELLVGRSCIPGSKKLLGPFIHAACQELVLCAIDVSDSGLLDLACP